MCVRLKNICNVFQIIFLYWSNFSNCIIELYGWAARHQRERERERKKKPSLSLKKVNCDVPHCGAFPVFWLWLSGNNQTTAVDVRKDPLVRSSAPFSSLFRSLSVFHTHTHTHTHTVTYREAPVWIRMCTLECLTCVWSSRKQAVHE